MQKTGQVGRDLKFP